MQNDRPIPSVPPKKPTLFQNLDFIDSTGELRPHCNLICSPEQTSVLDAQNKMVPAKSDTQTVDASHLVACPGFVNAHTHAAMSFLAGVCQERVASNIIAELFFKAESNLNPEAIKAFAAHYAAQCLKKGVTTVMDHYFYAEQSDQAFKQIGIHGWVGETFADHPTNSPPVRFRETKEYFAWQKESAKTIDPQTLFQAPHASDTVSLESLTALHQQAQRQKQWFHIHLAQTEDEQNRMLKEKNKTPVEYFAEEGLLTANTMLVHLIACTPDDWDILEQAECKIIICPSSQLYYAQIAPIEQIVKRPQLLQRTYLATDCATSGFAPDLLEEARIFSMIYKDRTGSVIHANHLWNMLFFPIDPDNKTTQSSSVIFFEKELWFNQKDRHIRELIFQSPPCRHVWNGKQWVLWDQQLQFISEAEIMNTFQQHYKKIKPLLEKVIQEGNTLPNVENNRVNHASQKSPWM